jgi:hypothetical protein
MAVAPALTPAWMEKVESSVVTKDSMVGDKEVDNVHLSQVISLPPLPMVCLAVLSCMGPSLASVQQGHLQRRKGVGGCHPTGHRCLVLPHVLAMMGISSPTLEIQPHIAIEVVCPLMMTQELRLLSVRSICLLISC